MIFFSLPLFSVQATVVSDVLVLYVLKRRSYYRENKYHEVKDPITEYEILDHKDAEEVSLNQRVHNYAITTVELSYSKLLVGCDNTILYREV